MFLVISFTYILSLVFVNSFIITDSFYFATLGSRFSLKKIEEIILFNKKFEWVSYILIPILLLFKLTILSLVLYIGIKLFDFETIFKKCFKIVLLAEFIPLLISITKTLFFYIYPTNNIETLQNFSPLGILNIFKNGSISSFLIYPLQQINLFEVAYWLLLAYGIKTHEKVSFKKSLHITICSYGVVLFTWCVFITFLQLQFS